MDCPPTGTRCTLEAVQWVGAALVMVEATAVSPEGRISPFDSGIWTDKHAQQFQQITQFMQSQNCAPAVQLAHAGRKASTDAPWRGGKPLGEDANGWQPIAPSPIAFDAGYPVPREMTPQDIQDVVDQFVSAARRSLTAGFQVVELHMAHGYLLHEFLSPLSNHRTDHYGGALENRVRLPLENRRGCLEAYGRKSFPCSFVFPAPTGQTVDGTWNSPSNFASSLKRWGST